jgi:putative peptidoglycan lipid II flippase
MELVKLIFKKLNNSITGGAIVIAIFSILAKLLGLVRDRLLASGFGAGDILDAYYAAFKLPDLIFNTLVLGALSAAFIPIFIELRGGKKQINGLDEQQVKMLKEAKLNHWQLSSAVMNIIFIVLFILSVIFFIFAPEVLKIIVPGFGTEKLALTIQMTRIMLVSILFFGISNVLAGILQSMRRFAVFALAPVMYNLGIIAGILVLVPLMGPLGLAWGVVAGAFLHMLVQLPSVIKLGFRWQSILAFKNKAVRQIGKLMLPRTIGLAANQINQLVITIIASGLISGSLAIFNLAFNLQSVPIGIFAVSLAITAFPAMSESFTQQDKLAFLGRFSITVRRILYLVIPMSIFMIALRAQIVRLVLGAGKFDWQDTVLTADALGFFCLSLFAQGLIPLLARAFYAFQNTKIPVMISLSAVTINIIGSVLLAPRLGVSGLVIAFSLASIIQLIVLLVILRYKIGHLDEKKIILSLIKIATATLGATLLLQMTKYVVANLVDMKTYLGVLTQFLSAGIIASLVYLLLSWVLGLEEVKEVKKLLIRNE